MLFLNYIKDAKIVKNYKFEFSFQTSAGIA